LTFFSGVGVVELALDVISIFGEMMELTGTARSAGASGLASWLHEEFLPVMVKIIGHERVDQILAPLRPLPDSKTADGIRARMAWTPDDWVHRLIQPFQKDLLCVVIPPTVQGLPLFIFPGGSSRSKSAFDGVFFVDGAPRLLIM